LISFLVYNSILGRKWTFLLLPTFLSSSNHMGKAAYPPFRVPVLARLVGPDRQG